MTTRATVLALCVLFFPALPAAVAATSPAEEPQGPMRVGDVFSVLVESPHPYSYEESETARLVRTDEIHFPGATYVAPRFSRFELAPGDYVIVRSPSSDRKWRYEGYGKAELGRNDGFWGIHVPGERLLVDLYSTGGKGAWGYRIDSAARGFVSISPEAICGSDDKENSSCYEGSEPEIYESSRAVARLLIQGAFLCTGWLVGDEGHLMTNNHCIDTNTAAMNTDYEFMAEGTCGQSCGQLQCDGTIVTSEGTLVQTSAGLDYSLILLDVNPTGTYGFLQLRSTGPEVGERIHIPQHPGGRGKEIAVVSTHPNDGSGFAEIDAIFDNGGRVMARYFADTEGGSSGSPVIGYEDQCVVQIHSGAFGCDHPSVPGNTGTVIDQIIGDLGANVPANAVVTSGPCGSTEEIHSDGFETGDLSGWTV